MSKLTVHDLVLSKTCKGTTDQSRITILKGINATFESGKLNAIMGANGSGKSTFLDILCGYCDATTKTSGKILLDGSERNLDDWFNNVTYIAQESYEIKNQTVRSLIQFAINLKNVETGGNATIEDYLSIIHDLYLEDVIDSNVDVLSGGEKQRALIASELVMERKILILDEPTSDLDSHLALNLLFFLRKIASEKDFTVILTIHQPSDQIFKLFDNLLFINDGKVLFDGEAVKIESFLSDHGIIKPEEWAISEFIFEAFYSESLFTEVRTSDEKTEQFKFLVNEKSDKILKLADLTSKNNEKFISQELSFKKAFFIAKRRLFILIRSKLFILTFSLLSFFFILFGQIIDLLPKDFEMFQNFYAVKALMAKFLNADENHVFSLYFFVIYNIFMYFIINALIYFSPDIIVQTTQEMHKNFYSPCTLALSGHLVDAVIGVSLFIIELALMLILGTSKYLPFSIYIFIALNIFTSNIAARFYSNLCISSSSLMKIFKVAKAYLDYLALLIPCLSPLIFTTANSRYSPDAVIRNSILRIVLAAFSVASPMGLVNSLLYANFIYERLDFAIIKNKKSEILNESERLAKQLEAPPKQIFVDGLSRLFHTGKFIIKTEQSEVEKIKNFLQKPAFYLFWNSAFSKYFMFAILAASLTLLVVLNFKVYIRRYSPSICLKI